MRHTTIIENVIQCRKKYKERHRLQFILQAAVRPYYPEAISHHQDKTPYPVLQSSESSFYMTFSLLWQKTTVFWSIQHCSGKSCPLFSCFYWLVPNTLFKFFSPVSCFPLHLILLWNILSCPFHQVSFVPVQFSFSALKFKFHLNSHVIISFLSLNIVVLYPVLQFGLKATFNPHFLISLCVTFDLHYCFMGGSFFFPF